MQRYELLYILPQSVADTEVAPAAEKIAAKIRESNATIVREEHIGRRKLAYPIKKSQYGFYERIELDAESTVIKALEQSLKLMQELLRFLIVKIPTKSLETLERERALQEKLAKQMDAAVRAAHTPSAPLAQPTPTAPAAPALSDEELGKKLEELLDKPEL